jgi:dihydroflavonol-4-reductase
VRVYVTGTSGFVGGHVARALREHGHDVRDTWVDLLDPPRLRRAVAGCDAVVHVAALYSFIAPARELEAVNVQGTRNVIEACRAAAVGRLVTTSSCATCGPAPGRQATEDDSPPDWELAVPYKRTKLEAERLVLAAGGTCVNPTTPVGEGDRAPTPTGAMIRGVAAGRFRAYPRIGLNVVDVRDVARGHVLALEHGRPGERYLLGGADLTMRDLFAAVADLAGRPRPRVPVPYPAIRAGAALGLVNRNEAVLARTAAYFSSAKAERELGYRAGPVEPALARAVRELVLLEPARERAEPDHAQEDQPDDQHSGDDVTAFRGGIGEQGEHRARV